jgi:hypothetical protein
MIGGDTRTAIEGGAQVAGPEPGPTVGETRPKRLGEGGGCYHAQYTSYCIIGSGRLTKVTIGYVIITQSSLSLDSCRRYRWITPDHLYQTAPRAMLGEEILGRTLIQHSSSTNRSSNKKTKL